jgi:NAD-dependent SIR2 family protein deacetylase
VQFTPNGPDILTALLHAHEEGRVAFFCGAGISYPAGLPLFKDLVQALAEKNLEPLDDKGQELFDNNEVDQVIGRYEQRVNGGRLGV